jgi:predicted alpha/beta hydrolase family esterase
MPPRVLIVPGWGDSGPEHWQSLWEATGDDVRRVQQRDWLYPVCAEWVDTLTRAIAEAGGPVVLAAHSLGCLAIAHCARGRALPIHGALLVAPPDVERPDFPPVVEGFAPIPRERLAFPSVVVASRDDPFGDFERTRALAEAWGSRLVDIGAHGHINAEAGFGPWPLGEQLLAELREGGGQDTAASRRRSES